MYIFWRAFVLQRLSCAPSGSACKQYNKYIFQIVVLLYFSETELRGGGGDCFE